MNYSKLLPHVEIDERLKELYRLAYTESRFVDVYLERLGKTATIVAVEDDGDLVIEFDSGERETITQGMLCSNDLDALLKQAKRDYPLGKPHHTHTGPLKRHLSTPFGYVVVEDLEPVKAWCDDSDKYVFEARTMAYDYSVLVTTTCGMVREYLGRLQHQ